MPLNAGWISGSCPITGLAECGFTQSVNIIALARTVPQPLAIANGPAARINDAVACQFYTFGILHQRPHGITLVWVGEFDRQQSRLLKANNG